MFSRLLRRAGGAQRSVHMLLWAGASVGAIGVASVQAQTTIGVGAGFMPKYEGSKKYTTRPYPVVNHQNGNFFIAPKAEMPAMGMQAELAPNWKIGVFGAYQWGRKPSDDAHLKGTKRIKDHLNAGAFTSYTIDDLSLDATYYHALRSGYGGGLSLGGSYKTWQQGGSAIRVGGVFSFMDGDAMKTNFGVTPAQSVASGGRLSTHDTSGGLKSVTVYGAYTHQLSQSWNVNAAVGLKSLTGDARSSPIVQDKHSVYGSMGVGYTF